MADEQIVVEPDVARIVDGLRDTGYEFKTAVADIIDNSLAANATEIDVSIALDFENQVLVSVADNGHGMNRKNLIEAMRYGSPQRQDLASLGKFGLGLKTASTAFCRRLLVTSRNSAKADPLTACWDLEKMAKANSWTLEVRDASAAERKLLEHTAASSSGTLVVWNSVDRVLPGYADPGGQPRKKALKKLVQELSDHIAMVYQRFLDPDDERAPNATIRVNASGIAAWDPFQERETKKPVFEELVAVQMYDDSEVTFLVRCFVLPRVSEFSSPEAEKAARLSADRQGVYIYRENRLIHGPDWLGMYKKEPHFTLARFELSFGHDLDEALQVDIKKSRILLDPTLYEYLSDNIFPLARREAEQRYRKGQVEKAKGVEALLHASSNTAIEGKVTSLDTPTITKADAEKGEAEVQNNMGTAVAPMRIVLKKSDAPIHVETTEDIDFGVMWEPALVNGSLAVRLNAGHPYYQKVYLPNIDNPVLIQSLDFILWSLAQAEVNNYSAETRDAFEEFRHEVSRNLKKLAADLPEPPGIVD